MKIQCESQCEHVCVCVSVCAKDKVDLKTEENQDETMKMFIYYWKIIFNKYTNDMKQKEDQNEWSWLWPYHVWSDRR